jgi:hypothetical protein
LPAALPHLYRVKKLALILGIVVLLAALAAAIVPMWVATSGISLSGAGLAAVIFMVLGCFAVGGGLMFLIFYSSRKGYDDEAHRVMTKGKKDWP